MKSVFLLLLIVLALDCCFAKKGGKEGKGQKCKGRKKALCKQILELKAKVDQLQKENDELKAPKPCIPNPCKNEGACKDLGDNNFECTCKPGFEGADCSIEQSAFVSGSGVLQGRPDLAKQLAEYLQPVEIEGKEWKSCFRASDNGYLASSFHDHCNNKGPTVTLVQVGRNVFGGYTDQSWVSGSVYGVSDKAFVFSLDNHVGKPFKSAVIRYRENSSYSKSGFGPTFGGGHDLHIADQCNANTKSYGSLGFTYAVPFGKIYGSYEATTLFAGLVNYRCDDYEVFYQA